MSYIPTLMLYVQKARFFLLFKTPRAQGELE